MTAKAPNSFRVASPCAEVRLNNITASALPNSIKMFFYDAHGVVFVAVPYTYVSDRTTDVVQP